MSEEKCDQEVFDYGISMGIFDMSKEDAEKYCEDQTAETGIKHDWHRAMGRAHIKALYPNDKLTLRIQTKELEQLREIRQLAYNLVVDNDFDEEQDLADELLMLINPDARNVQVVKQERELKIENLRSLTEQQAERIEDTEEVLRLIHEKMKNIDGTIGIRVLISQLLAKTTQQNQEQSLTGQGEE